MFHDLDITRRLEVVAVVQSIEERNGRRFPASFSCRGLIIERQAAVRREVMIWARIRAQNAVTTLQISRRFSYALTTPCKNSGVFSRGLECHPRPSCTWRTHMRHMPTLLKGASSQGLITPPRCRFFADVASSDLGTYSRDDLTKLGRKQLQYICKVLGINQGIKV